MRWQMVKSGSSYLSQSERTVTFGLGEEAAIERARLEWPSGTKQELGKLDAGRRKRMRRIISSRVHFCLPMSSALRFRDDCLELRHYRGVSRLEVLPHPGVVDERPSKYRDPSSVAGATSSG